MDFEDIFTDHVTLCILSVLEFIAVLELERGLVGWGGLISNLNSVHLRLTAVSWKKGYSCYISFFTNFALIYWTCLIGFGGKSHRFWNLLLCLGIGEGIGGLGEPYIKFELCPFVIYSCVMEKGVFMLYFIFHQFRTKLLDMPHRIWRKISQIM